MADLNQEARIPVYINDQQAKSALQSLTAEAEKWRKKMFEAMAGGDLVAMKEAEKELKKINGQMNSIKKEAFDVNKVLENISTSSSKDLRKAMQTINKEMDSLKRGTKEYNDLASKKSQIKEEFTKINSVITQQTGFLGKLTNSFNNLPGPVGNAVSGIGALGKSLWALVANPVGATIAAIVGSLMLLYKAFTSTDSGAVKMEGTLKAIGNIMDILIDRAMSYYKMLWSLVTFDWDGVKKNGKDAFGGITKAVTDAVNAGTDYASVMDDIGDREASAQIRMAKLRDEIEKLKIASKDVNKTAKEKSDLIDQAMQKEIELNGIEKGFMKERTAAEVSNLAAKINNSKLSMNQKEAQLKKWLEIDDKELASAMKKDAALADFVNKNEKEFQALQKMKADEFQKDADFSSETARLQKSAFSEKKALRDEEVQAIKEAQDKALKILNQAHSERMSKITNQYIDEGKSEAWFEDQQRAADMAYLTQKKLTLEAFGLSTLETEEQINQKRIEAQKELNQALSELEKDVQKQSEENDKKEDEIIQEQIKDGIKATETNLKLKEDEAEKEKKLLDEKQEKYLEYALLIGQTVGDLMNDSEATFSDYLKSVLLMSLEALHQFFVIEKAKTIMKDIGDKGFLGIATAMAKVALMEAAYQAVKGALTSGGKKKGHADGGYTTPGPKYQEAGVVHAGEYVIPQEGVNNVQLRPVIDLIENARRNGSLARLDLRPVVSASISSEKGYYTGGLASNSIPGTEITTIGKNNLSSSDPDFVAAINRLNDAADKILRWNPKVSTELIKKDLDTLDHIEKNRGL